MRLVQIGDGEYRTDDGRFVVRHNGKEWVVVEAEEVAARTRTKREAAIRLAEMLLSEITSQ